MTKSTALDGRAFNITCTQVDIGASFYLPRLHLANPSCSHIVAHVADPLSHVQEARRR